MDNNHQVDLSILIVNWNVKNYLRDCINSIYKETKGITFEIIVIDNASSDGSVDLIRSDFPHVRLIESKVNLGFGMANNLALPITKGKYIGLLNPDTRLINNAFCIMLEKLVNDSTIGIIGPKLLAQNGTIQRPCARRFNTYWDWLRLILIGRKTSKTPSNYLNESEYAIDQFVECVSGACMVFRRDVIKEERIFDPRFFMFGEDVDFCYTILHRGWKIFYLSKAIICHFGGESAKQETNIAQYDISAMYYLAIKRYGKLAGHFLRLFSLVLALVKLAIADLFLLIPSFRHDQKWINRKMMYSKFVHYSIDMNRNQYIQVTKPSTFE